MKNKLLSLFFLGLTSFAYGTSTIETQIPVTSLPNNVQQIAPTGPGLNVKLSRVDGTMYLLISKDSQIQKASILNIPINAIPGPGNQTIQDTSPPAPSGGDGAVVVRLTYRTATEVIVVVINYFYVDGKLVSIDSTVNHFPIPTSTK